MKLLLLDSKPIKVYIYEKTVINSVVFYTNPLQFNRVWTRKKSEQTYFRTLYILLDKLFPKIKMPTNPSIISLLCAPYGYLSTYKILGLTVSTNHTGQTPRLVGVVAVWGHLVGLVMRSSVSFEPWHVISMGAQWLSGRMLDLRPRGRGFEPHRRHCVVVLEQDPFILA